MPKRSIAEGWFWRMSASVFWAGACGIVCAALHREPWNEPTHWITIAWVFSALPLAVAGTTLLERSYGKTALQVNVRGPALEGDLQDLVQFHRSFWTSVPARESVGGPDRRAHCHPGFFVGWDQAAEDGDGVGCAFHLAPGGAEVDEPVLKDPPHYRLQRFVHAVVEVDLVVEDGKDSRDFAFSDEIDICI